MGTVPAFSSLGGFYMSHQSNLAEIQKKFDERQAESDKQYNNIPDDKKFGFAMSESEFNLAQLNVDEKKVKDKFKNVIIIHGIIIGFFILAEIGILLVQPKKDKNINIVIK
jgi:hypothetical protein